MSGSPAPAKDDDHVAIDSDIGRTSPAGEPRPLVTRGLWNDLVADARVFTQRRAGSGSLDTDDRRALALAMVRLAGRSDAFAALAAHRAGVWARRRGLPLLPWFARRVATGLAQVSIDPSAEVAGGLYLPHGQVAIGANCLVRSGVSIAPFSRIEPASHGAAGPVIAAGARLGTGCVVRGDVRVGRKALVGANAVVESDVADGATAVGLNSGPAVVATASDERPVGPGSLGAGARKTGSGRAAPPGGAAPLVEEPWFHDADTVRSAMLRRHQRALARAGRTGALPVQEPTSVHVSDGLATAQPADLSPGLVRSAITEHGHLLVKGALNSAQVEEMKWHIDSTLAAAADVEPPPGEPVRYQPFIPDERFGLTAQRGAQTRERLQQRGAVWLVDAPAAFDAYVQLLSRVGLRSIIHEYLGDDVEISVKKSVLRRLPPPAPAPGDWHQDGAFMGEGLRTLNVWMSLSDCTDGVPGMDVIGTRMDGVVPTGSHGAMFDWSVGPEMVEQVRGDSPILRPAFEAGDVLLFDEIFLHRTAGGPEMVRTRHAIESWFFAPGACPDDQIPFAL